MASPQLRKVILGKQLKDLTLEECAMIAGLPRNPSLYSPILHPDAALRRRNWVLDRMVAEAYDFRRTWRQKPKQSR